MMLLHAPPLCSWLVDCMQFLVLVRCNSHCSLFQLPLLFLLCFCYFSAAMHIFSAFPSIPVPSNYPSLTFQFFSPCSVLLNCTSLQRCVPSLCNCLPCFSFSDHASPSLHSTTCSWICLVVSLCLPRPADSVHSQPADQLSVENGNDLHVPPGS